VLGLASEGVGLLTTLEERIAILDAAGLDYYVILPFTNELSLMPADEYFRTVIVGAIHARHVVVGSGHAFGHGRRGNAESLQTMGEACGMSTTIVPELRVEGHKVSSSYIRALVTCGDVETARTFLGRPYSVEGKVEHGDGLGATFGIPTANVHRHDTRKLLPGTGVYIVRALVGGSAFPGVANIGSRPTVSDLPTIGLEVHFLGVDGDFYGQTVKVEFLQRLRSEQRFASVEELIEQMRSDIDDAKEYFNEHLTNKIIQPT
jgi:riboflavin kinase/FMN adenylyltransferase